MRPISYHFQMKTVLIDEIEGYFNADSEKFDPVLSELEYSGLQDSDFSTSLVVKNPLFF